MKDRKNMFTKLKTIFWELKIKFILKWQIFEPINKPLEPLINFRLANVDTN